MKWNYIHLLTLICVLLLTCNGLHADEACSPDYPDQFPFYPEGGEGCDDVTPLVWDHDNSATILAVNSSGTIYVTGAIRCSQGHWVTEQISLNDCPLSGHGIWGQSPVYNSFQIIQGLYALSIQPNTGNWAWTLGPCDTGYYCRGCRFADRCNTCNGWSPCSTGENIPVPTDPVPASCGGANALTNHCMETAEFYWPAQQKTYQLTDVDGMLIELCEPRCSSDDIYPSAVTLRKSTAKKYLSTWSCISTPIN